MFVSGLFSVCSNDAVHQPLVIMKRPLEAVVINDAVMVGLLRESVIARSPVRQTAARLMLALARRDGGLPVSPERLETIRADSGSEVAHEVAWLSDHLGIAFDSAQ